MIKPKPRRPATVAGFPGLPLEALPTSHGHALAAWMSFNRALLEGAGKLQQETSRFVVQRLEDDMARQQRLLACRSPQDLWEAYADFARQAMQDYRDEAGRLSEIAAEVQYACTGFGEIVAADVTAPARPEDA